MRCALGLERGSEMTGDGLSRTLVLTLLSVLLPSAVIVLLRVPSITAQRGRSCSVTVGRSPTVFSEGLLRALPCSHPASVPPPPPGAWALRLFQRLLWLLGAWGGAVRGRGRPSGPGCQWPLGQKGESGGSAQCDPGCRLGELRAPSWHLDAD